VINIVGLDKADVLVALYNNAKPLGMGLFHYTNQNMSKEEAANLLSKGHKYFDYVHGRVMKVDLSSDIEFNPYWYDRDNGKGSAERAIHSLR